MRTILFFRSSSKTNASDEKFMGVLDIARRFAWHVQSIDTTPSRPQLCGLLEFWHPAGIIVECGERDQRFTRLDFGNLPVVFIDRDPKSLPSKAFCVLHDSEGAGREAARELIMSGFRNFAYVPFPGKWSWCEDRRRGFVGTRRSRRGQKTPSCP